MSRLTAAATAFFTSPLDDIVLFAALQPFLPTEQIILLGTVGLIVSATGLAWSQIRQRVLEDTEATD